ncbi:16S rRNA (cytidine(1402)-2'-O)-methyltransferase [Myxococcota bacterium]|nr:16S rRNA (cytidine(1402)-2'-O)-methyltransferase [Myxococcota bacterium]
MGAGTLFVVATPIGNLEDLTPRALRVLREVAVIACEDTRVTRKLLSAHDVHTPTVAYHAHSSDEAEARLVERLVAGEDVALVSDAGTPLLSDPGSTLVARAIERGVAIVPVPGASALLAALVGSGLPAHRVLFLGFLPRADVERREVLAPLREAPYTLVIYESPRRAAELLDALARTLGDRPAVVARELTKKFETFERGALTELARRMEPPPPGEIVVVVAPPATSGPSDAVAPLDRARDEARRLLAQGLRASDVAKTIAGVHGLARQEAYQLVLDLRSAEEPPDR